MAFRLSGIPAYWTPRRFIGRTCRLLLVSGMALALTLIVVAIAIILNIIAARRVAKSSYYESNQKRAQYWLIWLLPIVGATLAFALAKEEKSERVTTDLTESRVEGDASIRLDSATGNPFSDHASHD